MQIMETFIQGNLALLFYVFMQCAILLSLYTSGIITAVVTHKLSDLPFQAEDLPHALQSGKYTFISTNKHGVRTKKS